MLNSLARAWVTADVLQLPGWARRMRLRVIRGTPRKRLPKWMKKGLLCTLLVVGLAAYEMRTSAIQSRILSYYAKQMSYTVEKGPSSGIVFPKGGPFNVRRGYTRIPEIERRLESEGFRVIEQARFSRPLLRVAAWGVAPPYREPAVTGLVIRGAGGVPIYDATRTERVFHSFEEISPLMVQTLLLIENRELAEPVDSRSNPVVEWDRLAKAVLLYAGSKLGLPLRQEGASTLATQLEKYQHSAQGRTNSIFDKLQQMTSASLKVYSKGPDTRQERREIIVDYLNSVPLAAAQGYGEVDGMGNGLYAWFGLQLADVNRILAEPGMSVAKVEAYKHVLTLLCAVRAPSYYLYQNRAAVEARANHFLRLIEQTGLIDSEFARRVKQTPLRFLPRAPSPPIPSLPWQKASNAIRVNLLDVLGVQDFYDLNQFHLEVESTIDVPLQNEVAELFEKLRDSQFLEANGLRGERLLSHGDPAEVVYSLMLWEKTPQANVLRVHTDNLDQPFDLNEGMKLELGSTAKLRTLVHYLEVVSELRDRLVPLTPEMLKQSATEARDPITRWAAETLSLEPGIGLDALLQKALDRSYSANPSEVFFTGGGTHLFKNFDKKENGRIPTVREATQHSTNLVYVRIMRDLVRYHEARLSYDADAVLSDPDNPVRRQMLLDIAEDEAKDALARAFREYRGLSHDEVVSRLLGSRAKDVRQQAILFFAWKPEPQGDPEKALAEWLEKRLRQPVEAQHVRNLVRNYENPRLTLADYAYLLRVQPLELWCAGELFKSPSLEWKRLFERSGEARKAGSGWLFEARSRKAQDLRLRIRIERDAFVRMTPYWKRLGFPFEDLVPSLGTAIGSSSDRPAALAELIGIIVNDGLRMPAVRLEELRFGSGTPYHTVLEPEPAPGMRVMEGAVARAVREVLTGVVEKGTARRLAGAFANPNGTPITAGGKTGSGDNRFQTVSRGGQIVSSRVLNRTATFVFYIGDRYFGVITAFVPGQQAEEYEFTSALPVAILRLLGPSISARFSTPRLQPQIVG